MKSGQAELVQITPLPQLVPSRACFTCSVCCRFPEPDSFLRPYFTEREISQAVARGIDPSLFPDPAGGQVTVVPHPSGEGYLCPAFNPATAHCRIYEVRPLDCQIYPLAVMWNEDCTQVVLGWDRKCPFLTPHPSPLTPDIGTYAARIAGLLEREDTLETLVHHPRLIGPFQDDVVVVRPLPRLSDRLLSKQNATSSRQAAPGLPPTAFSSVSSLDLRPLTLADRPRFERALSAAATPLAAYAFAAHFIWRELFAYRWAELAGHVCLFADYADGLYMPLPPLPLKEADPAPREAYLTEGQSNASRFTPHAEHASSFKVALAQVMAVMREWNHGSAVTRVENVPEQLKPELESLGYRLAPKDPDYLYQAADLAVLAGDRFKSQRAACNRFEREQCGRYEAYETGHLDDCLALYRLWAGQQEARDLPTEARDMLKDAALAHREALRHHAELGLTGRVVLVDGAIRAYTFGFARTPSVFCVLLEVADRRIRGLAQFIFREFCREAAGRGCTFINTMDDSGLPSLARSKRAYHPIRLVSNYVLRDP